MSRIGKLPIKLPAGVSVTTNGTTVTVKGAKGTLTQEIDANIKVEVKGTEVHVVKVNPDDVNYEAKHGLYRALVANMIKGVTEGYSKTLVVKGVGWKVQKSGTKLVMNIGYSHPVEFAEIPGIKIECPSQTEIVVSGIDKTVVGQVAANIRSFRLPEPYHGYGIAYKDEVIERKEGKTGGKGKK